MVNSLWQIVHKAAKVGGKRIHQDIGVPTSINVKSALRLTTAAGRFRDPFKNMEEKAGHRSFS